MTTSSRTRSGSRSSIVGSREVIDRIKKNPLNRALRIDKFTLASLENVLREYYDMEAALQNIPTLAMLTICSEDLKKKARRIARRLKKNIEKTCNISVSPTVSRVGGGALPEFSIDSWAVEFQPLSMRLSSFEKTLRQLSVPVIGRIENDRFLLDVRTIQDVEIVELTGMLIDVLSGDDSD